MRHEPRRAGYDAAAHGTIGALADATVAVPGVEGRFGAAAVPWVAVEAHDGASVEGTAGTIGIARTVTPLGARVSSSGSLVPVPRRS